MFLDIFSPRSSVFRIQVMFLDLPPPPSMIFFSLSLRYFLPLVFCFWNPSVLEFFTHNDLLFLSSQCSGIFFHQNLLFLDPFLNKGLLFLESECSWILFSPWSFFVLKIPMFLDSFFTKIFCSWNSGVVFGSFFSQRCSVFGIITLLELLFFSMIFSSSDSSILGYFYHQDLLFLEFQCYSWIFISLKNLLFL